MPIRKYRKKRVMRRKFNRKKIIRRRSKIPRSVNGFPTSTKVSLKYVDTVSLTPGTGKAGFVGHRFTCNGLYDPDISAFGHQPRGHDQLAAIYNRYLVTGSHIKVTPIAQSTGTPITAYSHVMYGIMIDNNVTIENVDALSLIEGKQNKAKSVIARVTNSPNANKSLSIGWSAKKWFKSKSLFSLDESNAAFGNEPTPKVVGNYPNYRLWAGDISLYGTAPLAQNYLVEITYHVTCYEPKFQAQS